MFKKLLFICISLPLLGIGQGVFAEPMTFDEYITDAKMSCDDPEKEWNQWSNPGEPTTRLVPKLTYPEFEANTVNAWMEQQIKQEKSPLGREYLKQALDPAYIGNFDGFKSLEAAQNVYHARLNTLFDCAVIESRLGIILGLQESKALKWQSEILNMLRKEYTKLEVLQNQCLPSDKEKAKANPTVFSREINTRMVNTAGLQYCHYRKYLSYLDSHLNTETTKTLETEHEIWQTEVKTLPPTSDAFTSELVKRQSQLRSEIDRANRSLPRAIVAFNEMQRTYAAHLLLTIVYDDYVRLRDNLNRYMTPVSQLFEKAYNAMSPK